ncbi:MAG: hypothetical protein JWQ34_2105 [Mucilaginibacter sp.]|uniref:hypothetical protein n=1 Tax=Mucilaginibacter sp. TaxID=1882438 RepID=UPI002625DC3D|nr:hypothetical protein [Mucilaginibacter sp.]MDB5003880.1 hypothetical protein [Mucilaginibacter sp.]
MKLNKISLGFLICMLIACKSPTEQNFVKDWVCVAQSPNPHVTYPYLGKTYKVLYSKVGDYKVFIFTGDGLSIQCISENDTTLADRFENPSDIKFRLLKGQQQLIMEEYGRPNGLVWEAVK